MNEIEVRDYLYKNIHLIESDLQVLDKEYHMPNSEGASGRIDILAQDKYNNLVVIEIKRSDQASREALHEVHKYVHLLKKNLGAFSEDIRIMVVSTEWRELFGAFKEFVSSTPFMASGYEAKVLSDSTISVEKLELPKDSISRKLSRHHMAYLFEDNLSRDEAIKAAKKYFGLKELKDYVILSCEIGKAIPYPYCLYLAIRRMSLDFFESKVDETSLEEYREVYNDYSEEAFSYLEGAFMSQLPLELNSDETEISYPEKFHNMMMEGWSVTEIYRSGFFKIDPRMTIDFVIHEISSYDQSNLVVFRANFNTSNSSKLTSIKYSLLEVVKGIRAWENKTIDIMETLAKNTDTEVKIYVYNPMNILQNIYMMSKERSVIDWTPVYTIFAEKEDVRLAYIGYLHWNARRPHLSTLVSKVYGSKGDYFLKKAIHAVWESEEECAATLGLLYRTKDLKYQNGEMTSKSEEVSKYLFGGILNFLESNESFLEDLNSFYKSSSYHVSYDMFKDR